MKILFLNPPHYRQITTNVPQIIEENVGVLPPLGILYVAAYLKKFTHHQIKVLDCQVEEYDYQKLERFIREEQPAIIGMTALTFTFIDVINAARLIKWINPEIRIILGGPHVNIYPEETLKNQEFDFLVLGEGEETTKKLIDSFNEPEKLSSVPGLVFRQKESIIKTPPADLIANLDNLPFPARQLIPYQKYSSVLAKRFPVTTMFTSRGCPFKCLFCDRPHLGKVFRARSAQNVVDEMEECQKMGIKEIFIYDDTFSVNRQRVLDICSEIQKRKLDITWDIRTRVDRVDEEMLQAMKEAGCQRIHYGIEAGTPKILKVLRKGITLEQVKKAFAWTKKIGIQTLAYFMIGSPEETKEDIQASIKLAKEIKPDYAHFAITTPFPATDLYALGLAQKILPYDYWQEFAQNPTTEFQPYFWEKELQRPELIKLLKKAYFAFYFQPSYLIKQVLALKSWSELKFKTRMALNFLFYQIGFRH